MLDRISAFMDKLAGLPYWQTAVLAFLLIGAGLAGYLVLRPPSRPESHLHSTQDAEAQEIPELSVHVVGAVSYPGVYRLEEGDRVIDAIEEAGGPLPEADLEALNLAQTVHDGQKVMVPMLGEGAVSSSSEGEGESTKININHASEKELEELPGIGPTLAGRIVSYREKSGGFRSVEELKQVTGIGEKKFAELKDLVEI
jgi:competence protein ComEA